SENYISRQDAIDSVLDDIGMDSEDIIESEIELEEEDGTIIYEIEIETNQGEYEYIIKAVDGIIIDSEFEDDDENDRDIPNDIITESDALNIALDHAGVDDFDSIQEQEIERDYDEPLYLYEIEFETSEYSYEYLINAKNSDIISFYSESLDD
ncbi:MAG: PepSY domain-containing protein, partial [bacterium]